MPVNTNNFLNWVRRTNDRARKGPPLAGVIIRALHRAPAESLEIGDAVTSEAHGPDYFVADKDTAKSSTDIVWGRWFVG